MPPRIKIPIRKKQKQKLKIKLKTPSGKIEVQAVVNSETKGTNTLQLYNRDDQLLMPTFERVPDPNSQTSFDGIGWQSGKSLKTYSLDSNVGKKIVKAILKGDLQTAIDSIKLDNVFETSLLQIKISGLNLSALQAHGETTKKRIKDYFKQLKNLKLDQGEIQQLETRSFIKPENILKKYRIFRPTGILKNPYVNYDDNFPDNNYNCFYHWMVDHYPETMAEKAKEQFNRNDGVPLQDIIDFAEKYRIKCNLLNVMGQVIYSNHRERSRAYCNIQAIIANGHFYPASDMRSFKPKRNTKPNPNPDGDLTDCILYQKNQKTYSSRGYTENLDPSDHEIDQALFKGLKINFSYANDLIQVRSLAYYDEEVDQLEYEYDMNKAYFNVAYHLIEEETQYPIFTCFDLWELYDHHTTISDHYYYTISESALSRLPTYGVTSNFRCGFLIKFLLESDLIEKKEIEYYKKPTYLGNWKDIQTRITEVIDHTVRKILKLEPEIVIGDQHIKDSKIDRNFVFYNGLMGKYHININETLHNLDPTEYDLLNFGLQDGQKENWTMGEDGKYFRDRVIFKHFNNTTIYNMIVEHTNLVLLKNLISIRDQFGLMPLKINVDCLGYDTEIEILPEFQAYFKIITEIPVDYLDNFQKLEVKHKILVKPHLTTTKYYHDLNQIKLKIIDEIDCLSKNISYQGSPGTGKTHQVQNHHQYDFALACTNICSLNISTTKVSGSTIFSKLQLYNPDRWSLAMGRMRGKTVWIDEFSMVNRYTWNFFVLLCIKYQCKLIISGDIHQISPINESKIDINHHVFKKLMGNQTILTKEWRNDQEIIKLRNQILNSEKRIIYSIFKKLDSKEDWSDFDRHLTFTNNARKTIHQTIIQERDLTFKFHYKFKNKKRQYVSLEVSNGVILAGECTRKKEGILKRDRWKVISKLPGGKGYRLYCFRNQEEKVFSMELMKCFSLGYAMTTHSAQGLTIEEDLCIHEITKMIHVDIDILYTAVTRCRKFPKLKLFYKRQYNQVKKYDLMVSLNDTESEYDQTQKVEFLGD